MIQPRPVRSFTDSQSKASTSLSAAFAFMVQLLLLSWCSCMCIVKFGVKLAGPSSEGSSVEQCRPT